MWWLLVTLPSYTGSDYAGASQKLPRPLSRASVVLSQKLKPQQARSHLEQGTYMQKTHRQDKTYSCVQEYSYYPCSVRYEERVIEPALYSHFYCKGCSYCGERGVCGIWPCDSPLKGHPHRHVGQGVLFPEQDQCPFLERRVTPLLVRPDRVERVLADFCTPYARNKDMQCIHVCEVAPQHTDKMYRKTEVDTCAAFEQRGCICDRGVCIKMYDATWCAQWKKSCVCVEEQEQVIPMPSFSLQDKPPIQEKPNRDYARALGALQGLYEGAQQATVKGQDIRVFGGHSWRCHVDIMHFRDCCKGMDGWGKHVGFGCSEEERTLAELRHKKRCVFVGSYTSDNVAGVSVREEKVFCCFPGALMRVLQEHAHHVLKKSWGQARYPDCQGLSVQGELEKVDFSTMPEKAIEDVFDVPQKEAIYDDLKHQIKNRIDHMEQQ